MPNVKERTQKEMIDYIRTHSKDGRLTKSMLDIAQQIGYSNATVYRALKALETKGLIEINQPPKPTEPNTIVFKGNLDEVDELISRGVELTSRFKELATEFEDYLKETDRIIRRMDSEIQNLASYTNNVVSVSDIPDTDLQMITIRKQNMAQE